MIYPYATYRQFLNNVGLLCGLIQHRCHWFYDKEDDEYKLASDEVDGLLLPPHGKTLQELFDLHVIYYNGSNDLV